MLDRILASIQILLEKATNNGLPAGTILRVKDIRDPRVLLCTVVGFDSNICNLSMEEKMSHKFLGADVKINSADAVLLPTGGANSLYRYTFPVEFCMRVKGKIELNKKKGRYYLSPNVLDLLSIDPEAIAITRLRLIESRGLFLLAVISEEETDIPFSITETGAILLDPEYSKVIDEVLFESGVIRNTEIEEISMEVSKTPTVVKSDRLSFTFGHKIMLPPNQMIDKGYSKEKVAASFTIPPSFSDIIDDLPENEPDAVEVLNPGVREVLNTEAVTNRDRFEEFLRNRPR
jgi:hypothetical protein